MEQLAERLTAYTTIGLDTPIFIYHLEAHPVYQPLTRMILSGVEHRQWTAITSTITLMEITVRPWQVSMPGIARKYEALLVNFPNLKMRCIDREVARRAAQLRAELRLRPADALQAAACLVHGAQAFITNDKRLDRLGSFIHPIILDDYTPTRSAPAI